MTEVTIKAHTRRGKDGKVVQVHSYSRRVGKKGVHSPKRKKSGKSEKSGEELEKKVIEKKKKAPKLTPEELAEQREAIKWFKRAEAEMKSLGMTREQYSRYKLKKTKESAKKPSVSSEKPVESSRNYSEILERVEDKVAKFVEKYSKKKYKRQL